MITFLSSIFIVLVIFFLIGYFDFKRGEAAKQKLNDMLEKELKEGEKYFVTYKTKNGHIFETEVANPRINIFNDGIVTSYDVAQEYVKRCFEKGYVVNKYDQYTSIFNTEYITVKKV